MFDRYQIVNEADLHDAMQRQTAYVNAPPIPVAARPPGETGREGSAGFPLRANIDELGLLRQLGVVP